MSKQSQLQAVAASPLERAALVLAIDAALKGGVSRRQGCFPAVDDLRALRRVSRRLWASLGVTGDLARRVAPAR